jgi:hypothetical protein
MTKAIDNINEASSALAQLPEKRDVTLPGGRRIVVYRLSWLKFEALWAELAAILSALLAAGEDLSPERIAAQLTGAPAFVLRLCSLSTNLPEDELARWNFDEVLALGAESLSLNFAESAGVRGFFTALSQLSGALD